MRRLLRDARKVYRPFFDDVSFFTLMVIIKMGLSVDRAIKKAKTLVRRGEILEAEVIYKAILDRYPKNINVLQHYEKLKAGMQSTNISIIPLPTAKVQELSDLLSQGRIGDVILKGSQLLTVFPRATPIFLLVGIAHAESNQLDEAIKCFKKAVTCDPLCADGYQNMGLAFHQKGKFDSAIECYGQVIKINPGSPDANADMGNAQKRNGDLKGAIESYIRAIKIDPGHAEAHNNLGASLHENGDFDRALENYETATEIKPDYAEAFYNLGNLHQDRGDFDLAIASFAKAITLNPNYLEAHNNVGQAKQLTGDLPGAISSYRRVIEINPESGETYINLGLALTQVGDLDGAFDNFTQALKTEPYDAHIYFNLGNIFLDKGNLNSAIGRYRQALELKRDFTAALNNMGFALKEKGDLDEAMDSFKQALKINPDYADAHNNLGVALQQAGDLDGAMDSYRQALEVQPDSADAFSYIGSVLNEKGDLDGALRYQQKAIDVNPDYAPANFQKAKLLLNRHDFQRGWPLYVGSRDPKSELIASEVIQLERTPTFLTQRAERWDGSSLRGKKIQVHAAQGVGDEIMFSSCIPDLFQEFPSAIYLECDPRLQPLFARSFPEVTAYGRARSLSLFQTCSNTNSPIKDTYFDYSIPIDGLPQFFRNKIEDFPERNGFLVPSSALIDKWGERLADLGEGLKVGISWLGGGPKDQKNNSIPLAHWNNLLSLDAFFINLQYGDTSDEVARFKEKNNIKIYDWEDNNALVDLDSQAALISELDLVISVDNATVHSCIALGTEVWNMLDPSFNLMWMDNRTGLSPLSRKLRLFKKKNQSSWEPVLNDVKEQLRKKLSTL